MKNTLRIFEHVLLLLISLIIFSQPTIADYSMLRVKDGFSAGWDDILSNIRPTGPPWNELLNTESPELLDVFVKRPKDMSVNQWMGIYFDNDFPIPYGYIIDSVIIRFKCRYVVPPGGKFYCDCSNNKNITGWSDADPDNQTGYDVNISTHEIYDSNSWHWEEYDVSHLITTEYQINNMEVLIRNDESSSSALFLDVVTVRITYSKAITIVEAETIDDDGNGQIDAYHITFSTPINDSTLEADANGFDVAGYDNESFTRTGLPNHPDTADDEDIFISFTESGSADTDSKPELTYSHGVGTLQSFSGYPLLDVKEGDVIETDGAAPAIVSAKASDDSGNGAGIQAGDTVQLIFSENTNAPNIDSSNIDTVLNLNNGHTWKDVSGNISSSEWITSSVLLITLSVGGGVPTIAAGDIITPDGTTITDSVGNVCAESIYLTGDFGSDTLPPYMLFRETQDLNSDGCIDAIHIIFNEKISTSSVVASDFGIIGIGDGKDYLKGDSSDKDIYITFNDGLLKTDAIPSLSYIQGSLTDTNGNPMLNSPPTQCLDKAPPAILSAVASDGTILVPGVDGDDTVTIVFSEKTNRPTIDSANIDSVFVLSNSHTWKDAMGGWNTAGDELVITFGLQASSATVSEGDDITISSTTTSITDGLLGNICTDVIVVTGTFIGTDTISPWILSNSPQDKNIGISINTLIRANFSERMDEEKTKNAISINAIRDNNGNNINEVVSGDVSYENNNSTLIFTPKPSLKNNFTYQVIITSLACDTIGNPLPENSLTFTTIMDHTQDNIVLSWDEKTRLSVMPHSLTTDFFFEIDSAPKYTNISTILQANDKLKLNNDPFSFTIEHTLTEITTINTNNEVLRDNFEIPITITLSYNDIVPDDGIVDGTTPPVREETLQMYYLDEESNLWVRLAGSVVDTDANTVSAPSIHTSVFSLIGSSYSDLSIAYAFPVPFKPSRGDREIKFVNLSPRATIEIFTLSGDLVKRIEHINGRNILSWDVTNDDGKKLASGVYLYLIKNQREIKKGKLMVIK